MSNNLQVAVCFHGQPRALNDTIIQYLTAKNPSAKMDTYVHTWWQHERRYRNAGLTDSKYDIEVPADFLQRMWAIFQPKGCMLEEPKQFTLLPNFQSFEKADASHVMPMMYSIHQALSMPSRTRDDVPYAWYVKVRFDLVIQSRDIVFSDLDPTYVYMANIHPNGYPDASIIVIPHQLIHHFHDLYNSLPMCGAKGIEEHVLYSFMQLKKIKFKSLNLRYVTDRVSFRVPRNV